MLIKPLVSKTVAPNISRNDGHCLSLFPAVGYTKLMDCLQDKKPLLNMCESAMMYMYTSWCLCGACQ